MRREKCVILGAGVTGLAAGYRSGLPIFEANEYAGGACRTYYYNVGNRKRVLRPENPEYEFRFEVGGGHWIHSRYPHLLEFINELAPLEKHTRRASVWIRSLPALVPYPLQQNVDRLPERIRNEVFSDWQMDSNVRVVSMKDWLLRNYGRRLCELFFYPFHENYTAGHADFVQPPDQYKNLPAVVRSGAPLQGYNETFYYPIEGMSAFVDRLASKCEVHYGKSVAAINSSEKIISFEDGELLRYDMLLSSIPLHKMWYLVGKTGGDPVTSLMVVNIAGFKGSAWIHDHWAYVDQSKSGFHRIGFYSNVTNGFLPPMYRGEDKVGSLYVELAVKRGESSSCVQSKVREVVGELLQMNLLAEVLCVDASYVETAYVWKRVGSTWAGDALRHLAEQGIYQIGRSAEWNNQGIVDSIARGLHAGRYFCADGYSVHEGLFQRVLRHEEETPSY